MLRKHASILINFLIIIGIIGILTPVVLAAETRIKYFDVSPNSGNVGDYFGFRVDVFCNYLGNLHIEIDCDNNGSVDWTKEEPYILGVFDYSYTYGNVCRYSAPGTYTVKVRVQQNVGTDTDFDQVIIVSPPVQTLGLSISPFPSSGNAPLYDVDIVAAISGNVAGPVTYSFDCTSDGGWELIQVIDNNAYTATDLCDYISPGVYRVRVQAERGGLLISGTVNVVVGQVAAFAVRVETDPFYGTAPLNNVDLIAHVSGAASGILVYRFDCTSDGSWEKTVTTDSVSYTAVDLCHYAAPGNYTAKIQVERAAMRIDGTAGLVVLP